MQQSLARCSGLVAKPAVACRSTASRSVVLRGSRLVVRAEQEAPKPAEPMAAGAVKAAPGGPPPAAAVAVLLGANQEAINGRAAMLGLIVAIVTELSTNQSVWSQVAGKVVDSQVVEHPVAMSTFFFYVVVAATSLATFAPQAFGGLSQGPSSRSFGPFTPKAEASNGRAAMIGFASLLIIELVRGNTALF